MDAIARQHAAADRLVARVGKGVILFQKDPKAGGGWRIIGPAEQVVRGRIVEVTKADGSTSWVQVDAVARTGERVGVRYAVADFRSVRRPLDAEEREAERRLAERERAQDGPVAATRSGRCVECGRRHAHLVQVQDSSGVLGWCCPRCAATPREERSFA